MKLYGDAGDRIPVRVGEEWTVGPHRFICSDLKAPDLLTRVGPVDMVYVDPPWDPGNARAFRTKAGLNDGSVDFAALLDRLIGLAAGLVNGGDIYCEMGKRNAALLREVMARHGRPVTDEWATVYYRTKPALLMRSGAAPYDGPDLTGMDDEYTPAPAISASTLPGGLVLDLCAGRGLTPLTAATLGRASVSVELHPRRLAVAIDKVAVTTGHPITRRTP